MSGEREKKIRERTGGAGDGGASDRGRWRAEGAARLSLFVVRGVAFDEERGKGWQGAWVIVALGLQYAGLQVGGEW
jgi:hypothetical protein